MMLVGAIPATPSELLDRLLQVMVEICLVRNQMFAKLRTHEQCDGKFLRQVQKLNVFSVEHFKSV